MRANIGGNVSPRGFFVRYSSRRALDADHTAYLTHGGMVVPIDDADPPAPDTPVRLRLEGPGGLALVFTGRAGAHRPGRGLMISFDDDAWDARQTLDDLVQSEDFRTARDQEPAADVPAPEFGAIDAEVEAGEAQEPADSPTDPFRARDEGPETVENDLGDFDAFDEPTPLDPRPPENRPPLSADPDPFDEGTELHPDVTGFAQARPTRRRRPAPTADRPPTVIRAPRGGEAYHVVVLKLFSVTDFVTKFKRFFDEAHVDITHDSQELSRGGVVRLRLTLPGHNVFEMWSVVEDVAAGRFTLRLRDSDDAYVKAKLYPESVAARARQQREATAETPSETASGPSVLGEKGRRRRSEDAPSPTPRPHGHGR